MSRDYDTTLARMAGNIAAGLAPTRSSNEEIAARALSIAESIVFRIRQCAAAQAEADVRPAAHTGEAPRIEPSPHMRRVQLVVDIDVAAETDVSAQDLAAAWLGERLRTGRASPIVRTEFRLHLGRIARW